MLCVSSSYVTSTLRTTLINASFQQHGRPHGAVAPKLRGSRAAGGQHRDTARQEKDTKTSSVPGKRHTVGKPIENYTRGWSGLTVSCSFSVFFEVGRLRRREDLAVSADVARGAYNTKIGRFWTELAAKKPTGVFVMKNYVRSRSS